MNGVKPGDRVWIFRSINTPGVEPSLGWHNIGKTLRVIREATAEEQGPDTEPMWLAELLEPATCTTTGEWMPAGYVGMAYKSCVKPLRDPDSEADETPISIIKELTT